MHVHCLGQKWSTFVDLAVLDKMSSFDNVELLSAIIVQNISCLEVKTLLKWYISLWVSTSANPLITGLGHEVTKMSNHPSSTLEYIATIFSQFEQKIVITNYVTVKCLKY